MTETVFILLRIGPCKACREIWLSDDNGRWQRTLWQSRNARLPTQPTEELKMGNICHKTNCPSIKCPDLNSLAPGRFKVNFRWVILKLILMVNGWGISCEIALIWVSLDHTYDKSTLVQVMAWCRQATSHYMSQCWPRSLSPYGVIRPRWINLDNNLTLEFRMFTAFPCNKW